MKKLYIALTLGCVASGNFAMGRENTSRSRDLSKLTFQEIAQQEGQDLSGILASLRVRKTDDSTTRNEQFIERNFGRYNALKEMHNQLSESAKTYSIAFAPLTIQEFAKCTHENIVAFEKQIALRLHTVKQQAGPENAKKIETSLGDTAYAKNVIQIANTFSVDTGNGKANRLVFLRKRPVLIIGIASALIGSFVLFRYLRK
jgi:hypothetical protein